MRIMGLDFGSRTVGVAISDSLLLTAQGVEIIRRKEENKLRQTLARIEELIVENEVDEIINSFAYRLQSQGLKLETYLKYTGQTIDTMRQQYAPEAERRVRTELTLKAIAAAENVTPTDDEISDKIDEFAKQAHQTPEEFKEKLTADDMEYIGDIVKLQKTVDMLKKEAKYIDKPAEEPKTEEKAEDKAE